MAHRVNVSLNIPDDVYWGVVKQAKERGLLPSIILEGLRLYMKNDKVKDYVDVSAQQSFAEGITAIMDELNASIGSLDSGAKLAEDQTNARLGVKKTEDSKSEDDGLSEDEYISSLMSKDSGDTFVKLKTPTFAPKKPVKPAETSNTAEVKPVEVEPESEPVAQESVESTGFGNESGSVHGKHARHASGSSTDEEDKLSGRIDDLTTRMNGIEGSIGAILGILQSGNFGRSFSEENAGVKTISTDDSVNTAAEEQSTPSTANDVFGDRGENNTTVEDDLSGVSDSDQLGDTNTIAPHVAESGAGYDGRNEGGFAFTVPDIAAPETVAKPEENSTSSEPKAQSGIQSGAYGVFDFETESSVLSGSQTESNSAEDDDDDVDPAAQAAAESLLSDLFTGMF